MKLIGNNNENKYEIGNFSEELNRMADNIKIPKKRNIENKVNLENGWIEKPRLLRNLIEMENTLIKTTNQKDHDTIMQIYEIGGWKRKNSTEPTEKPYLKSHCSEVKDSFTHVTYRLAVLLINHKIIMPEEFYKIQHINVETIKEINKWFEKYKPNRASKWEQK